MEGEDVLVEVAVPDALTPVDVDVVLNEEGGHEDRIDEVNYPNAQDSLVHQIVARSSLQAHKNIGILINHIFYFTEHHK